MMKTLIIILISFFLIDCKSYRLVRDDGKYSLVSKMMKGSIKLNSNGTFDYGVSGGLFNQHSTGFWINKGSMIVLHSKYQKDSTFVVQKNIPGQDSLTIISTDLLDILYEAKVIIDNRITLKSNGELYVDYNGWENIKVLFFNYTQQKVDTISIDNQANSNYILIKHLNTLNFPNYRFFNKEAVSKKGDKIFISDPGLGMLLFKK